MAPSMASTRSSRSAATGAAAAETAATDSGDGDDDKSLREDIPCLLAQGAEQVDPTGPPRALVFSHDAALARPLQGAQLGEAHCAALPVQAAAPSGKWCWRRSTARRLDAGALRPRTRRSVSRVYPRSWERATRCGNVWPRAAAWRCWRWRSSWMTSRAAAGARSALALHATFLIDDPNLHRPELRTPALPRAAARRARSRLSPLDCDGAARWVVRRSARGAPVS